jgi:hypothetical protein
MNNPFIYFAGLLMVIMSLMTITSQEYNHSTLNNTIQNSTTLSNMSLNLSALNNTLFNAADETAFMIGSGVAGNKSIHKIGMPTKPVKDASKLGYIIQATPHGYV